MKCPRPEGRVRLAVFAAIVPVGVLLAASFVRGAPDDATANPGQFFTVTEPITHDVIETLRSSAVPYLERAAEGGHSPILVFEFRPGDDRPGVTSFGAASDLADLISSGLGGARLRVAYVPEPLSGFAVLAVLACDEIVLGPKATLGPIATEGHPITAREREAVRILAERRGRPAGLLLGMLDRDAGLSEVRTADGATHYVLASDLPAFRTTHQVVAEKRAWDGGTRGVLSAEKARQTLARLLADDRAAVAQAYHIPATDDPTLGGPIRPVVIRVEGPLNALNQAFLLRQIAHAQTERANLIFFEIDSDGGLDGPASKVADAISRLEGIKTVAYIDGRAVGMTSLVALACDQIVFQAGARMGDVRHELPGRDETPREIDERTARVVAEEAERLARLKGHPEALARAMVDRDAVVLRARDARTGAVALVLDADVKEDPARYQVVDVVKSADGEVLTLTDESAKTLGMADRVVRDFEDLQNAYGLRGQVIRRGKPTWVDALVTTLSTSWMKGLLLFVGFFMLVLELKLPGVGLPAITSALAFLLYFWSSYLGGTADQLEILLFLVGVVCLAIELFVFPGFGVFGMSGILLVLVSVVMASHTFVWPTQDYQYRQMGWTLMQVVVVMGGVIVGAVVFGRYFPSLPLFSRMVLKPETEEEVAIDPTAKPSFDPETSLLFLLGERGRTTSVLRPTGKARFGELLADVTADGFFIEADTPVEVVEVRGSRVIVKRAGAEPG